MMKKKKKGAILKNLETGKDKIQKICDALKKQTLEPAKQQAEEIIENAKMEARNIVEEAQNTKEKILEKAEKEIEEKKKQSLSSLKLSSRQVIDELKQQIEKHFFNKNLKDLVIDVTKQPNIIAKLIEVIIQAIKQEGIDTDVSAYIPKKISTEEINKLLISDVVEKLKEKKVIEGDFSGGAKIKMHDLQITLDISDKELTSLIADYVREDFRDMIFNP